jgi:hypothetical protein
MLMCPICAKSASGPLATRSSHIMLIRQEDRTRSGSPVQHAGHGRHAVYRLQLIVKKVIYHAKEDLYGKTH